MLTRIWGSEGEPVHSIEEDPYTIMLSDTDGVLVLDSYQTTGSHTASLMFFGPCAEKNVGCWEDFTSGIDEGDPGYVTETESCIRLCFGVPVPD